MAQHYIKCYILQDRKELLHITNCLQYNSADDLTERRNCWKLYGT
jgi:hypothetical protein